MLPQASTHMQTDRSVTILIDLPDQNQDNKTRLQRGLKSQCTSSSIQLLEQDQFKVHTPGLHNKRMQHKTWILSHQPVAFGKVTFAQTDKCDSL